MVARVYNYEICEAPALIASKYTGIIMNTYHSPDTDWIDSNKVKINLIPAFMATPTVHHVDDGGLYSMEHK